MSWSSGIWSRACRVVNATRVPGGQRGAVVEHVAGDEIDQRRRDREERLHRGEEGSTRHGLLDLQPGLVAVGLAIALDLRIGAVEHLGQQDAGDAERLLGDGGHLRE